MMSRHSAKTWLHRLAVVACSAFCFALPAKAAIYTDVWDPTYGSPFTNLGWRGSAEFYVPDSCKSAGTEDVNNLKQCDGAAQFLSASVQFYDTRSPGLDTLITVGFSAESLQLQTLSFVEGALVDISSSLSAFVFPDADLTDFGVLRTTEFSLQFTLDGPRLAWGSCNGDTGCTVSGFNDAVNFPPTYVITEVPEPATPALVGLALTVAAWRLRRRAQR